jgi:hypothetical protein
MAFPAVPLDVFTQGTIDARLIAFAGRRVLFEQGHNVGVQPQFE